MSKLHVSILSFGKILLQKEVTMAVLPGYNGDIGIIPSERDFVYILKPGILYLFNGTKVEHRYFITSGKFEAKGDFLNISTNSEIFDLDNLNNKAIETSNANLKLLITNEKNDSIKAYYEENILLNNQIINSINVNEYKNHI